MRATLVVYCGVHGEPERPTSGVKRDWGWIDGQLCDPASRTCCVPLPHFFSAELRRGVPLAVGKRRNVDKARDVIKYQLDRLAGSRHMTLRADVISGLKWTGGARLLGQLATWGITIVVMRLLTPADYGLLSLATIFVAFLGLVSEIVFLRASSDRRTSEPRSCVLSLAPSSR